MEITGPELTAQYQQANSTWPFIHQTEVDHGLPRMLLFAVGSRETNLTNEVGDFGHGHGVWQLDDRSHTPPGGFPHFDADVPMQCDIAAAMLKGILATTGGNVEEAAAIYNSGQPGEAGTTHGDYGIDVGGTDAVPAAAVRHQRSPRQRARLVSPGSRPGLALHEWR